MFRTRKKLIKLIQGYFKMKKNTMVFFQIYFYNLITTINLKERKLKANQVYNQLVDSKIQLIDYKMVKFNNKTNSFKTFNIAKQQL